MFIFKAPKEFFVKAGVQKKLFPTHHLSTKTEVLLIKTDEGHETTILEHESDFVYYILEGEGYFLINDKREECKKGDLVYIPAGNKFTYKGKLKMLLTCTPQWKSDQEKVVA